MLETVLTMVMLTAGLVLATRWLFRYRYTRYLKKCSVRRRSRAVEAMRASDGN